MTVAAIGESGLVGEKAADIAIASATGEWATANLSHRRTSPTHDEIAHLAFILYESRGRQDGHDIADWLQAERELGLQYA